MFTVGLDFDNTMVSYDALFYGLAVERGLVDRATGPGKTAVRDAVRASAPGEAAWRMLQALAYGENIRDALLFPGLTDFLDACGAAGARVFVISHKTRHPATDPGGVDLHAHAMAFMECKGLFGAGRIGREDVFFEPTRAGKLRRIAELTCAHFVDDLPEVLLDPDFPKGVRRIHFAPDGSPPLPGTTAANSWGDIRRLLFSTGADRHARA